MARVGEYTEEGGEEDGGRGEVHEEEIDPRLPPCLSCSESQEHRGPEALLDLLVEVLVAGSLVDVIF